MLVCLTMSNYIISIVTVKKDCVASCPYSQYSVEKLCTTRIAKQFLPHIRLTQVKSNDDDDVITACKSVTVYISVMGNELHV